jgi:uncharacterized membrane protein
MAAGAGLGALFGKVAKMDIDRDFETQVRDMLQRVPQLCSLWSKR